MEPLKTKTMKKTILTAILSIVLFSGCGLSKKITKSESSDKTTEKTTETTSDSKSSSIETQPTTSQFEISIPDLSGMVDGFTQRITSGNGSESVITKRGGKLVVENTTAGSKESESSTDTTKKETTYNSEFVIKETKKIISRLPWWIWLAVGIWLIIVFRKFIAQILIIFFPGAVLLKIFSGSKE